MMNLLARILSHGFAFAVVALIIIVLIYRGDLFQELELPEFLVAKTQPSATSEAGSGTVDRLSDETAATAEQAVMPSVPSTEADSGVVSPEPASEEDRPVDVTPATDSEVSTDAVGIDETAIHATEGQQEATEAVESTPPQPVSESQPAVMPAGAATTDTTDTNAAAQAAAEDAPQPSEAVLQPSVTEEIPAAVEEEIPAPAEAEVHTPAEEAMPVLAEEEVQTPADMEIPVAEGAAAGTATPDISIPTTTEVTEPAATEAEESPKSVAREVTETPYAVMAKAREAYWLRDFENAEQQYRKLIQLDPDNPDGYGEMGNMYFSQGEWEQAAEAYYQAGKRLLNENMLEQAKQMLEVIRGLNGPQADDLEALINAASVPSS